MGVLLFYGHFTPFADKSPIFLGVSGFLTSGKRTGRQEFTIQTKSSMFTTALNSVFQRNQQNEGSICWTSLKKIGVQKNKGSRTVIYSLTSVAERNIRNIRSVVGCSVAFSLRLQNRCEKRSLHNMLLTCLKCPMC